MYTVPVEAQIYPPIGNQYCTYRYHCNLQKYLGHHNWHTYICEIFRIIFSLSRMVIIIINKYLGLMPGKQVLSSKQKEAL